MGLPTDVEPDEGRQPDRPLGGRAVAEVRERDQLAFQILGETIHFVVERIELRDDGVTFGLRSVKGGWTLHMEHTVTG